MFTIVRSAFANISWSTSSPSRVFVLNSPKISFFSDTSAVLSAWASACAVSAWLLSVPASCCSSSPACTFSSDASLPALLETALPSFWLSALSSVCAFVLAVSSSLFPQPASTPAATTAVTAIAAKYCLRLLMV